MIGVLAGKLNIFLVTLRLNLLQSVRTSIHRLRSLIKLLYRCQQVISVRLLISIVGRRDHFVLLRHRCDDYDGAAVIITVQVINLALGFLR